MIVDTELKYRPQNLSDFVFPNDALKKTITDYATGKKTRQLVLAGPNGTGKSLLADLLPDAIEGKPAQVNKVRMSALNSDEDVEKTFCYNKHFNKLFTVNGQRFNYNIIEELNVAPSSNATNKKRALDALRIVVEEYRGTDLFIITTNELQNVDRGIRSRAEVLTVLACTPEVFFPRAKQILEAEGLQLNDDQLLNILKETYAKQQDNRAYYKILDRVLREV